MTSILHEAEAAEVVELTAPALADSLEDTAAETPVPTFGTTPVDPTQAVRKKRKRLELWEQQAVIRLVEKGELSQKQVAERFGIQRTTVTMIMKRAGAIDREVLLTSAVGGDLQSTKRRTLTSKYQYKPIDEAVFKWYSHLKKENPSFKISGEMIKEKALAIAKVMKDPQIDRFKASSGWLKGFQKRYAIEKKNASGKVTDAAIVLQIMTKQHDNIMPTTAPTVEEATVAFRTLQDYFLKSEHSLELETQEALWHLRKIFEQDQANVNCRKKRVANI